MSNSLFNPYLFWEEDYTPLEDEFINFIRYIPLAKEHEEVWSFKLVNLLLLIGSSIDSFFKCSIASLRASMIYRYLETQNLRSFYAPEDFEMASELHRLLLKDEPPNMGLYRNIFEEYYNLSNKTVYVLRTKDEIKPFKEWMNGKSPEWWKIYRDLKHSRFGNRKSANLKIVLNALSALFLLNIYHTDTRGYLYNNGVIRSNMKLDDVFFNSREPDNMGQPLIAKTNIFGYIWDNEGFWKQHPWNILDPGNTFGL